jgi:serine/threonine protein kinase
MLQYDISDKLGKGKFGEVWGGINRQTGEKVAIKVESANSPRKMLKHETSILHYLYSQGCNKVPLVYWYGMHEDSPTLIMTCYDITLDEYSKNRTMTKDICNSCAKQMIDLVKSVHSHSILHRDIKPQNFMFKGNELYLIDFGLASSIDDNSSNKEPKFNIMFNGTPKYVSVYVHHGLEEARRDDLISIGYIYLYLSCGRRLPWENIPHDREKEDIYQYPQNHILHYKNEERKHRKSWDQLKQYCAIVGNGFLEYMQNLYELEDTATPNYSQLIKYYNL